MKKEREREKTKLKSKTTNDVVDATWNKWYTIWSSWSESVRLIFNHLSEWHVGHRMARSFIKIAFSVIDCGDLLLWPVQPFARQLTMCWFMQKRKKTEKSDRLLLLFIVADASERVRALATNKCILCISENIWPEVLRRKKTAHIIDL